MTDKITAEQKRTIVRRANGCCEYCQSQARFAMQSFSVEHIIPLGKGGKSELPNIALACQGCNNHKYNKTEAVDPATNKTAILYSPRQHQWYDHFAWNEDFTLVLGITPIGRATVEALKLNRVNVVNLRRILYEVGEHPPK